MDDAVARDDFVYSQLITKGLPTLSLNGIYNKIVTPGKVPPYTVFDVAAEGDMTTNGNLRVMSSYVVSIQAVVLDGPNPTGQAGYGKPYADQMCDAIETAMGGRLGMVVVQNGYAISVRRKSSVDRGTISNDRQYRYRGGKYLITLRPTSIEV